MIELFDVKKFIFIVSKIQMQADRRQLEKYFIQAVNASILLKSKQKRELINAAKNWPDTVMLWMLEKIRDKNTIIDSYIDAALAEDKEGKHLQSLQKDIRAIRLQAGNIDQEMSRQNAENMLKEL